MNRFPHIFSSVICFVWHCCAGIGCSETCGVTQCGTWPFPMKYLLAQFFVHGSVAKYREWHPYCQNKCQDASGVWHVCNHHFFYNPCWMFSSHGKRGYSQCQLFSDVVTRCDKLQADGSKCGKIVWISAFRSCRYLLPESTAFSSWCGRRQGEGNVPLPFRSKKQHMEKYVIRRTIYIGACVGAPV